MTHRYAHFSFSNSRFFLPHTNFSSPFLERSHFVTISVIDIFSVGVGPSSSHTVGPMRAAKAFMESLPHAPAKVHTELRGSLSATGKGHATDRAVILGLAGWAPLTVPIDAKWRPSGQAKNNGAVGGVAFT